MFSTNFWLFLVLVFLDKFKTIELRKEKIHGRSTKIVHKFLFTVCFRKTSRVISQEKKRKRDHNTHSKFPKKLIEESLMPVQTKIEAQSIYSRILEVNAFSIARPSQKIQDYKFPFFKICIRLPFLNHCHFCIFFFLKIFFSCNVVLVSGYYVEKKTKGKDCSFSFERIYW